MKDIYRIHGDNIVECERIAKIIVDEVKPTSIKTFLFSPSTIVIEMSFSYQGKSFEWRIELLPGFNKSGRRRWEDNIFKALKQNGSFLDETPDAIVSKVDGEEETILYAIEFCSALQAGNQAWQRSGRAFSTGRTGCPYLYIVDFVKYELDPRTRERKALRFPNAAVPYSYINFSKDSDNFVAQVYVRSEEFDKNSDRLLRDFNEDDFAEKELSRYIVKRMCGIDTSEEENIILQKNLNVVMFLAKSSNDNTNFTTDQWRRIYAYADGIVKYSIKNARFNFHKTITAKGHHGKSPQMLDLIDGCSVGLASRDLPFGIIPADKRKEFAKGVKRLYPNFSDSVLQKVGNNKNDLILCLIKGFKPRGDDNRPDRGLLPLATMLSSTDIDVMTYLYGPVLSRNYELLKNSPKTLANQNGLWKSILSLSDFVLLDVPILSGSSDDAELLLDTAELKKYYTKIPEDAAGLTRETFSSRPQEYHEDDVDTGIHYLFAHILKDKCFEGMCNPPGGDWSGFSVIEKNKEKRWLSLPRVSDDVDGKRPDHIIEMFGVFDKPLLLSIESKERSADLEPRVGKGLINYIKALMSFVPNVEREKDGGKWSKSSAVVKFEDFEVISAAAYLRDYAQSNQVVFDNSKCDMLLVMDPIDCGWNIEIIPNTAKASELKKYISNKLLALANKDIVIR